MKIIQTGALRWCICDGSVSMEKKKMAKLAGGVVVGAAKGSVGMVRNVRGLTYRQRDFDMLIARLREQSLEYQDIQHLMAKSQLKGETKRDMILDSIGLSLPNFWQRLLGWKIPDDLQQAYELAYPDKAADMDFRSAIESMDENQLEGFVNGLKGKLFEIRYTDYLNDGHLPAGCHAEMAQSATQPGWDIAIYNSDGSINDVLQLKATESAQYIENAFERYPHIDIVSTDEVYSQVTMGDMSAHLIDSGISNEELSQYVLEHVDAAEAVQSDSLFPSVIPYILIAYSVSRKVELSDYRKGNEFGRRSVLSYVCHALGVTAAVFTHTWWLAPVTSVSLRLANHYGEKRSLAYQSLKRAVNTNETVLKRYRNYKKRILIEW